MSGTSDAFGDRIVPTITDAWSLAAASVGCSNLNSTQSRSILKCMRTKEAKDVFEASQNASKLVSQQLLFPVNIYVKVTGIFGPVIDNITIFENYTTRGQRGQFIHKPVIVGSNMTKPASLLRPANSPPPTRGRLPSSCTLVQPSRQPDGGLIWVFQLGDICTLVISPTSSVRGSCLLNRRVRGAYPNVNAPACPGKPWHGQELEVMFGTSAFQTGFNSTKREDEMGSYFR